MTVPRNKLQERFVNNTQEHLAPDPSVIQESPCFILKVFDTQTIDEEGLNEELIYKLSKSPGYLFAEVQVANSNKKLVLPFKESEEHLYAIFGNRVQLENRSGIIQYRNLNIENGYIIIQRNIANYHLPLDLVSQVFDFGGIV